MVTWYKTQTQSGTHFEDASCLEPCLIVCRQARLRSAGRPLLDLRHADEFVDRSGNAVGVTIDQSLVATFNQKANLRLGSRIAEEDASSSIEPLLRFFEQLLHGTERFQRRLLSDLQIALSLRVFPQPLFSVR